MARGRCCGLQSVTAGGLSPYQTPDKLFYNYPSKEVVPWYRCSGCNLRDYHFSVTMQNRKKRLMAKMAPYLHWNTEIQCFIHTWTSAGDRITAGSYCKSKLVHHGLPRLPPRPRMSQFHRDLDIFHHSRQWQRPRQPLSFIKKVGAITCVKYCCNINNTNKGSLRINSKKIAIINGST